MEETLVKDKKTRKPRSPNAPAYAKSDDKIRSIKLKITRKENQIKGLRVRLLEHEKASVEGLDAEIKRLEKLKESRQG